MCSILVPNSFSWSAPLDCGVGSGELGVRPLSFSGFRGGGSGPTAPKGFGPQRMAPGFLSRSLNSCPPLHPPSSPHHAKCISLHSTCPALAAIQHPPCCTDGRDGSIPLASWQPLSLRSVLSLETRRACCRGAPSRSPRLLQCFGSK